MKHCRQNSYQAPFKTWQGFCGLDTVAQIRPRMATVSLDQSWPQPNNASRTRKIQSILLLSSTQSAKLWQQSISSLGSSRRDVFQQAGYYAKAALARWIVWLSGSPQWYHTKNNIFAFWTDLQSRFEANNKGALLSLGGWLTNALPEPCSCFQSALIKGEFVCTV